jgi:hypothetical protein
LASVRRLSTVAAASSRAIEFFGIMDGQGSGVDAEGRRRADSQGRE